MTQQQHYNLWEEHRAKASAALKAFINDGSRTDLWEEYKSESKIANKHWGIAQAMFTKKYGKVI